MADLAVLFKKTKRAGASEAASAYFGEALRRQEARAAAEMEHAWMTGNDERRALATAEWLVIRRLFRQFEQDLKIGEVAQGEIDRP